MISIAYSEIPDFLRSGSFFESLSALEKNEEIQVSERCFAWDGTVDNIDDFRKILNVTAFWCLDVIPTELISFCSSSDTFILTTALMDDEYAELGFAQDLLEIFVPSATTTPHHRLVVAIKLGRSEVVKYLASELVGDVEATTAAAAHGRVDYLELLYQHGHPWDYTTCDAAATRGHVNCLRYLHEKGCKWRSTVVLNAAKNGHFECMKYAHEQGLNWHFDTIIELSTGRHLEMLKYAVEHGCLLGEHPTVCALLHGHVECLRYLLARGCTADDFLARKAVVQGGHLGCIDLLLKYSHLALDVFLISDAAFWGHLHVVEYLHQRGCPWDWQVPKEASRMGYFDILLYAMENGCDCAPDAVMDAVQSVCESGVQGLKYLIEQRGLPAPYKGLLLMEAFIRGNYLALEYLFTIGPGVTNISKDAVVRSTWKLKFQTAYYDSDDYDLDLSKCIECAFRNHFDIFTEVPELVGIVKGIESKMPLCNALLRL